jgi:hypothetical protein
MEIERRDGHIRHMAMTEPALENLRSILDRLGPGAWLHVDDRWLSACFGEEGPQAADRFAKAHHCSFIPDGDVGGRFGRAYFKKDRHA